MLRVANSFVATEYLWYVFDLCNAYTDCKSVYAGSIPTPASHPASRYALRRADVLQREAGCPA